MTPREQLLSEAADLEAAAAQKRQAAAALDAEPDPLLVEAREIAGAWFDQKERPNAAEIYRSGRWDGELVIEIALAALRRGMELAPLARAQMGEIEAGERIAGRLCDWGRDGEAPVPLMQEAAAYIRATLSRVPVAAWPEPKPDAEGWIDWHGGKNPVTERTRVEVALRCGDTDIDEAGVFVWRHTGDCDDWEIIRYRILPALWEPCA